MTEQQEIRYCVCNLSPELSYLELYILSDLHYGNPFCNLPRFARQMEYVLSKPNVFIILNGDLLESSIRTSKGDIYNQVGSPQDQRDRVIEILLPVRERILGMTCLSDDTRVLTDR